MISYHVVPYLDGFRISRGVTAIEQILVGGRYRPRKVTRFQISDTVYPDRAAARAYLCRLAMEAEFDLCLA